jgi:hypothetical protein
MTSDEFQMTKEIQITKEGSATMACHSNGSFVFRHSLVIRHSSFVICATRFLLVLLIALSISCSSKRITKANVDQIIDGMSKKQVESILGPPTNSDRGTLTSKKTTYIYRQGKDTVTIIFNDDKVQSKESTLSD